MAKFLSLFERLAFSTIRIECLLKSGDVSTGTGFFFRFRRNQNEGAPVIITNKHVIDGAVSGRLYFTLRSEEGDPIVGQSYSWIVDKFEDGWIPHPDPEVDLCMFPLVMLLNLSQAQGKFFYIIYLEWNLIPTEEEIEDFVGMENIIMVGYPNGIWDKINNFPILRSGVAATHYRYDWNGRPEFLIDCACFPGSSGSPVLVSDVGQVHTKKNISIGANRIKLLGILYAGPQHRVDGKVEILPVATTGQVVATSLIPNNLGIVIKARKLKELEEIALNRPK